MYRIRYAIRSPFYVPLAELTKSKELIGETPEEQLLKQKWIDTDGDGISDWDELNVYRTNPNMRDSCGDGITDNIRVTTGKNLVCPKSVAPNQTGELDVSGLQTSATGSLGGIFGGTTDQLFGQSTGTGFGMGAVQVPATGASSTGAVGQSLPRDATVIREYLKGQVDQAQLDQISDQDLLNYYDQAMQQASQPGRGQAQP